MLTKLHANCLSNEERVRERATAREKEIVPVPYQREMCIESMGIGAVRAV